MTPRLSFIALDRLRQLRGAHHGVNDHTAMSDWGAAHAGGLCALVAAVSNRPVIIAEGLGHR
jgi:hypothetical protein